MPLSDREQQILADIEARLRAEDPKFARAVQTTTVSAHLRRRIKLSAAAFVVGFLSLLLLVLHIGFGMAGFALMLAGAVSGINALKRLGQAEGPLGDQIRGGFERYRSDRDREE
ncbi:MAG TPA: DUF3040 domain-containing protein [Egibacteraceae bacterium]|nr:DUF3040 domain-containing protein [Egibacteraceae bacterium]